MYEFLYEFSCKNSLTGHFLVHPKSYVFFMNSYEFMIFHEFICEFMIFHEFIYEL